MNFKIGDKVVFKKGKLSIEWYREQAVGTGTIIRTRDTHAELDVSVRWEDGSENGYASCDLIHYKETPMRTMPTKEQVLEAARQCPQTKEALEILFPEDFEVEHSSVLVQLQQTPMHFTAESYSERIRIENCPKALYAHSYWNLNNTTQFILAALQVALEQADASVRDETLLAELRNKLVNGLTDYTTGQD